MEPNTQYCYNCRWLKYRFRKEACSGSYWCEFKEKDMGSRILGVRACTEALPCPEPVETPARAP